MASLTLVAQGFCFLQPRNRMKKAAVLACLAVSPFVSALGQQPADSAHPLGRLSFLIGDWRTMSTPPGRSAIPGYLSYSWALGEQWIEVHFDGHPPDGGFWGAVAMIRYDRQTGEYVSWAFFGPDDPVRYTGSFINDSTLRFSHSSEQGEFGIDYSAREDGTVFQHNWRMTSEGARQTTLETIYQPVAAAESSPGGEGGANESPPDGLR